MSDSTSPQPCGNQLSFPPTEFERQTLVRPKRSYVLSSCRICLSAIFDPAALTCGHRFCENCLDQYWQMKEKPNFLICPLCRAQAYNVDFTEKENSKSDGEFRKNFSTLQQISSSDLNKSTFMCFKISMLIPILYFLVKWLKQPTMELASLLKHKFWYKM